MASTAVAAPEPVVIQTADRQVYKFPTEEAAAEFEGKVKEAGGACMRLAPLAPPLCPAPRPLYDLEAHLVALLDTEEVVPPEQAAEFGRELESALLATVEKRDRVGQFMAHVEAQIAFAESEIKRLQNLRDYYARSLERMTAYVTHVIEGLGLDARGKRKTLEGTTVVFALHGCDKRVNIKDEAAVPTKYKRVTVTLPVETWELMIDSLDLNLREQVLDEAKNPQIELSRTLAKADLKAGVDVPGAELAGGYYLVRK